MLISLKLFTLQNVSKIYSIIPKTIHFSPAPTEISTSEGNVIVIREAPTSSSSESNFTDPETEKTLNLTVAKLEQLDLVGDLPKLEIFRHENVNFSPLYEMPIVKSSEMENGTKGFFGNVSRVKKVELSEISLASDICEYSWENSRDLATLSQCCWHVNDLIKAGILIYAILQLRRNRRP